MTNLTILTLALCYVGLVYGNSLRCPPSQTPGFPPFTPPQYPECLRRSDYWDTNMWKCECPQMDDCPIAWNQLSVTYAPSASSSRRRFITYPTSGQNMLSNWVPADPSSVGCSTGNVAAPYIGKAYAPLMPGSSTATDPLRLLFDGSGNNLIGIQLKIDANLLSNSALRNNKLVTQDSSNNGYITAYLRYPSSTTPSGATYGKDKTSLCQGCGTATAPTQPGDCFGSPNQNSNPTCNNNGQVNPAEKCYAPLGVEVCNPGVYSTNLPGEGVGRGLWQQMPVDSTVAASVNATNPNTLLNTYMNGHIPYKQQSANMISTMFAGQCVRGIGNSYLSTTTSTPPVDIRSADFDTINPIVPIYNAGRLNAMAFITDLPMVADCTEVSKCISQRGEQTSIQQLEDMFGERQLPRRFYDSSNPITMIHIYFTENPAATASC